MDIHYEAEWHTDEVSVNHSVSAAPGYTRPTWAQHPTGPPHNGPRGHLNIKMSSYQCRDPHVKDKTVAKSCDHLIFNMGIPTPRNTVFILRQGPAFSYTMS